MSRTIPAMECDGNNLHGPDVMKALYCTAQTARLNSMTVNGRAAPLE
jgi:hypothetical protein